MGGDRRGAQLRTAVASAALAVGLAGCMVGGALPQRQPDEATAGATTATLADTTLARLVDEILPEVERSSGLTATRPLNVAVTNEEHLRSYLEKQLASQLPDEEAVALTAAYARLGLVPDTLDLRGLLAALLQEQVIGYYDPITDTLFVHDRVPVADLEPVLAHEMVHALQDQYVPLDSIARSFGDRSDPAGAYQAATEGHATYAMMEWQLAHMTGSQADLTKMPDLGPMLSVVDLSELGDFGSAEILSAAPAIIREGMIFPYVGGLVFMQRLWKERPDHPLPLGDGLPRSTEQILHVDRWLDHDVPTSVRFTEPVSEEWELVLQRDLGEFETRVFMSEHLGDRERADAVADGWDGDKYRLVRRGGQEALMWVSVWDTPEDAEEFAVAAREAYAARYHGGERTPTITRGDGERPTVTIVDAPPGISIPPSLFAYELSTDDSREVAPR